MVSTPHSTPLPSRRIDNRLDCHQVPFGLGSIVKHALGVLELEAWPSGEEFPLIAAAWRYAAR